MPMVRLVVLLVLLVVLAAAVVRFVARVLNTWKALTSTGRNPSADARRERFVPCARCGLHVLESRSLPSPAGGDLMFCSPKCREEGSG